MNFTLIFIPQGLYFSKEKNRRIPRVKMKIHNCFKRHLIIPSVIISVLFSICLIMGCVSYTCKNRELKSQPLCIRSLFKTTPSLLLKRHMLGHGLLKILKMNLKQAFIAKNSPAALVDVRVGDIIESIDNLTFRDRAELLRFYDRKEPGDEVNAVIKETASL